MVHSERAPAARRGLLQSKRPSSATALFTRPAPWAAPKAEVDEGFSAGVLKRTVAPQAHAHFQRIVQVTQSELSKLLIYKVHQIFGEPVRPEVAAAAWPLQAGAFDVNSIHRKDAARWRSASPAEAESLTAYVTGVLERVLVEFSRFADAVLRWQLDDDACERAVGPEVAEKVDNVCNHPPLADLIARLERLDKQNTELEVKYNAVSAELCEKRRAFLRDQAAAAERLQRVRSHCHLTGNQALLDLLEHNVQFYSEPEPEMEEDEVTRLRNEYEDRITAMQQEHEARLHDNQDKIFSMQEQLERSREIEQTLRLQVEQMVRQRRATGSLEKALSVAEEAAEKAEAELRTVKKDVELFRASNRTMTLQITELENLVEQERREAGERENELARRLADLGVVHDMQERCARDLPQVSNSRPARISRRDRKSVV